MNAQQLSAPPVDPAPGVRLTRRGRTVVLVLALGAMLVAGFLLGSRSVASEEPGVAPPTEAVVVAPGETLWEIASEAAEPGETRAMMREIERLNALESVAIDAGQRLRVPVAADAG